MAPRFVAELSLYGQSPALVFEGRPPISYAELARRAGQFAERLGRRSHLVAIEAANSEHAVIAYVGALIAGKAVALLPADDAQAADAFVATYRPEAVFRRVDGRWRLMQVEGDDEAPHPDLALVLTTSGSTGQGKAVRLSATAVDANARSIASLLGLSAQDRAALVLPYHYSYGLSVVNSHLAVGASIWFAPGSVLAGDFTERLNRSGSTNLAGVPYTYELLERIGFRRPTSAPLRFMAVAGGRLEPALVKTYHDYLAPGGGRFFLMYGQTEATARIAYVPPDKVAEATDRIGIAIPGGRLGLVDDDGNAVTTKETVGELTYRGPNVMMGYATTRADLERGAEINELATGDLALLGRDGLYRIVGRKRRMSKIAGVRIGHDALEAALAAEGHRAAVVGDDHRLLAAYVGEARPEDVRRRLAAAARLTLRHVEAVRLPELPRRPNGKTDYELLGRRLSKQSADPDRLIEAFRQVFFPHHVGEQDSFGSLGGDSLRHVELSMLIERRLGRLPNGWEDMTIADLSRLGPSKGGWTAMGVEHAIRSLAILLVVVQHATLWPIPGGSAAMVVLIGHGLARFQLPALIACDLPRFLRPLGRVLLSYGLILLGYSIAWERVPWPSVFLVGNFGFGDPVDHTLLPYLYWFVEAYAQMLLVFAGLFILPTVRRLAARDPFRFGLLLLAGALVARAVGPVVWPLDSRQIFTLPWVFYLAALGWCAALADTRARRLVVLGLALGIMPAVAIAGGNWIGSWVKYTTQFFVIAALLYAPRVVLPSRVISWLLPVAAASYHIYLFHRFVPELLASRLETSLDWWSFTALSIAGGVALGILVHTAQSALARRAAALRVTMGAAPEPVTAGS